MKEVSSKTLAKWDKYKRKDVKDTKSNKGRVSANSGKPQTNK